MSEAVEDMLCGFTCQECGEIFDDCINGDEPPGYPRSCDGCGPIPVPSRRKAPRKQSTPPAPMTPERIERKAAKARAKKARNRANRVARAASQSQDTPA